MNKTNLLTSTLLATSLGVMAWVGRKAADNAEQLAGMRSSLEALKDFNTQQRESFLRMERKLEELIPRREFEAKLLIAEAEQRKFDLKLRELDLEILKLKNR
jgi:hypothetical protein